MLTGAPFAAAGHSPHPRYLPLHPPRAITRVDGLGDPFGLAAEGGGPACFSLVFRQRRLRLEKGNAVAGIVAYGAPEPTERLACAIALSGTPTFTLAAAIY